MILKSPTLHLGLSLIIVSWLLIVCPHRANAGVIINRPLALGLEKGLVGYWSFDDPDMAGVTAYDRSGNGNNGTLTNGPVTTIGRIGQGLDLTKTNDSVNFGDIAATDGQSSLTWSFWAKQGSYLNSKPCYLAKSDHTVVTQM